MVQLCSSWAYAQGSILSWAYLHIHMIILFFNGSSNYFCSFIYCSLKYYIPNSVITFSSPCSSLYTSSFPCTHSSSVSLQKGTGSPEVSIKHGIQSYNKTKYIAHIKAEQGYTIMTYMQRTYHRANQAPRLSFSLCESP